MKVSTSKGKKYKIPLILLIFFENLQQNANFRNKILLLGKISKNRILNKGNLFLRKPGQFVKITH